ncbi:hypothetical protein RTBOTA2_002858 [Rhodotorula toruloides]|nr:hypothetical protein RTBOTA2_002858 [Rhodotorula toruloides]
MAECLQNLLGKKTKAGVASRITVLSESHDELASSTVQMDLISLRSIIVSFRTCAKTWQSEFFGILSLITIALSGVQVFRGAPCTFAPREARLFHYIVCHQVVVRMQLVAAKDGSPAHALEVITTHKLSSERVLHGFIARELDEDFAETMVDALEDYETWTPP